MKQKELAPFLPDGMVINSKYRLTLKYCNGCQRVLLVIIHYYLPFAGCFMVSILAFPVTLSCTKVIDVNLLVLNFCVYASTIPIQGDRLV